VVESPEEQRMIELTPEQLQALDASTGTPPVLVDQRTEETYFLVTTSVFEHMNLDPPPTLTDDFEIPEGIRQARAVLKRDLPALLANRKTRGRYVCYQRAQLIAINKSYVRLVKECVRLGVKDGEVLIVKVEPGAADDEEEIDRTFVEFDDD
jgi:hypothetical protein